MGGLVRGFAGLGCVVGGGGVAWVVRMGGVKVGQLTVEATSPMSSSRIPALERQSLVEVFADVPDPRGRRGRRYRLGVILALAAAAVLAGCRSLLAIWEHIVDLGAEQRQLLGLEPGQAVPFESTIRRVLAGVDADVLDARIGSCSTPVPGSWLDAG